MIGPDTHESETIDRTTSRSISDAVGERLRQYLKPHAMAPSPQLEHLIDELDRRERENRGDSRRLSDGAFFR
jgi:hypothetical protein